MFKAAAPTALHVAAPPSLNEAVLAHLGAVLSQAILPVRDEAAELARFSLLLDRLSAALVSSQDRDASQFRAELLQATPNLLRFAISLTRNPTEADDLVQDTVLKAWQAQSRFQTGTNFGAWLFTIMRNTFYSVRRKKSVEVVGSDVSELSNLASLPAQPGSVDLADAQKAITKLPATMREALILVAVENLSYDQAAAVMGCQVGTIKSRVARARERLVQLLGFDISEVGNGGDMLGAMGAGSHVAVEAI